MKGWGKTLKKWLGFYRPPIEISFSRLQTYQRCPWMYHLVFHEGWRAAPKPSTSLGLSLHRTLAHYLAESNGERTLDKLFEFYDQFWINEGFSGTQETLDTYDNGRKMLETFFEKDRERTTKTVATEHTLKVEFEGIHFWGTLDRLDVDSQGRHEVVEYKTHGDHWSPPRIETDLQMTLYAWGVENGLHYKNPRLKYFFLSTGEWKETQRTPEQKQMARQLMVDVARQIRKDRFEPNHSYCGRCDFGSRCVNYSPESKKES